jgi:DNA-binding transcriptional LysR family regulator
MRWADRVGQRLKPRDLHVFAAVAESRSMAKAAERLAVSRPVVSRAVGDLERLLEVRLFDRTPQGVEPTAYGEALLRHSRAVFDGLRQGVEEIQFLADPAAGRLRVGFSEVLAAGLVPAAIDRLMRRFPRMGVETQQGNLPTVVEHLKARRCELAVVRLAGDDPEVAVQPLYHEALFVVAGRSSRWATRRRVGLAELAADPWILSRQEILPGGPAWNAFHAAGVGLPAATIVSDSLNLRHGLLKTGRYLTLIPGSVLHYGPPHKHIRVLPVVLERWSLPTVVATLRGRTTSPIGDAFIATLHELARPLQKAVKVLGR